MLRRFGFGRASSLEAILAKPKLKLDELFENEDLLQEVHLQNTKLITFLRQPGILSQLVNYIVSERIAAPVKATQPVAAPSQQQQQAPPKKGCSGDNLYIACEILGAGVPALMDGLVYSHPELLTVLWALLDQKHTLTQRQLAAFCKSQDDIVGKWIYHIFISGGGGTPYLSDYLVSLIQCEGTLEGSGITQWLADRRLLSFLVDQLKPDLDSVNHEIAQQLLCDIIYLTPLLDARNPLIDELTSPATMRRLAGYMLEASPNASSTFICGTSIIRGLRQYSERMSNALLGNKEALNQHFIIFNHILEAFTGRLGDVLALLEHPRSVKTATVLGLERLAVCEFLVELLYYSSITTTDAGIRLSKEFYQSLIEHNGIPKCLDLFFAFPYNNVLHNSVYALLREIFTGSPRIVQAYETFGLLKAVLETGRLIERILEADEMNKQNVEQKLGRLGYMGHLTLLSKDICYVLMKKGSELKGRLFETDNSENDLSSRWAAHMEALDAGSSQQLSSQEQPVLWSTTNAVG